MDLKVLMSGKLPDFNSIKKEIVDHSDNLVKDN